MKTKFGMERHGFSAQKFFLLALFILTAVFVITPLVSATAHMMPKKMMPEKTKMMKKMNPEQARLIAEGKKLFYSESIGTTGLSCATCHVYSAGTYIKMRGMGMVIRPLKNAAEKIMAFNKMHHAHMTVEKKIAMCVRFNLKGSISKGELEALTAYVNSLR